MKIFISHSSHDKWVARQMVHLLEESGHETFLDEKDIKTGDSIDAEIQTHLKDADHLLLLLSPASIKSHWVFIELGGARALGKRVVPILFHVAANEIPSAISQLLARDINDFDKYIAELSPARAQGKERSGFRPVAARPEIESSDRNPVFRQGRPDGFAIGDEVTILQVDRLTEKDKAIDPKWVSSMDKYSGLKTRVTAMYRTGDRVKVAVDNEDYWWHTSWLSKAS